MKKTGFANFIKKAFLSMCPALILAGSLSYAASGTEVEKLVVGVPVDRCPVLYLDEETNEPVGIGADLIAQAASAAGYYVIFEPIAEEDLKHALDSDAYDLVMPFASAIPSASGHSAIFSDSLALTPFTLLTKNGRVLPPMNELRIGMMTSLAGVSETVKSIYPGIEITKYETVKESVKALRNGTVDALLNNAYVWSYILQDTSYSDLAVQPSAMFSLDFMAGTLDTPHGREIIERLNTGIATLTDAKRQAIVLDYTTRKLYMRTFEDLVYEYWQFILLDILLFFALLAIIYFVLKMRHLQKEKELQRMMDYDALTGFYNLEGFKKKVKELLTANPDVFYMLSFNDIADFKFINDSLGRNAGDELLKFWAEKSLAAIDEDEAMGRIDSDHIISFCKVGGMSKLEMYDDMVFTPLRNYFIDRGKDIKVRICTGVYALMPEDYRDKDVDKMIDCARVAEKKVHADNTDGYEFYNPAQWESGRRTASIVHRLPLAIQNEEIEVWYQPQVDYLTGKISGAEALCRWNHGELGWVSPGEFIPALEDAGLIYDLDCFVWDRVCRDLSEWEKQGRHRCVSINVSRIDIQKNRDIADYFRDLIKKYDLKPEQLRIEITESAYVEEAEILILTTSKLREYGFSVEMDDFGSGYSSLNMLKEVPVDRIKLDLRFLTETGNSEMGSIIITHMVSMIHELGMDIIAEGVETKAQAEFLKSRGLTDMQGYLFYKPMPRSKIEEIAS